MPEMNSRRVKFHHDTPEVQPRMDGPGEWAVYVEGVKVGRPDLRMNESLAIAEWLRASWGELMTVVQEKGHA